MLAEWKWKKSLRPKLLNCNAWIKVFAQKLSENFTLRQPHRHRHAVKKIKCHPILPSSGSLCLLSETQLKVNFASSPVLYIHNFAETVVSHHDLRPDFPSHHVLVRPPAFLDLPPTAWPLLFFHCHYEGNFFCSTFAPKSLFLPYVSLFKVKSSLRCVTTSHCVCLQSRPPT